MYHYFSRAIEKRIMEALRFCFDANPTHRDVVKNIREKFEFSERPQKGIVIQASSISPQPLSADNYMGVLHSHCMLAKVDGYAGTCVEWIRENDHAIHIAGGFMADPGVYYLQVEEVPDTTGNLSDFQFWVDPLLTVLEEPLITMTTGTETEAYLTYSPVLGDSVNLYSPTYGLLLRGTSFTLTADQSLYIGESVFGLEKGQVPAVLPTNDGPFTIVNGTNDILDIEVDGVLVTAVLNPGTYSDTTKATVVITCTGINGTAIPKGSRVRDSVTGEIWTSTEDAVIAGGSVDVVFQSLKEGVVSQAGNITVILEVIVGWGACTNALISQSGALSLQNLANQIQTALDLADVGATISVKGTGLEIVSKVSIRVEDDLTSTANTVFGFTEGYVAVSYEGLMTPAYVSGDVVLPLVMDGVSYQVEIPKGPRSHADIAQDIMTQVPTLAITTQAAGDYTFDAQDGKVTFLHTFMAGTYIIADYRYPDATRGPFPIYRGEVSNIDAIPGVVIAFGRQLVDGDVVAVSVDGSRSDVAKIYGGKAEVSLDVDIIARDSRTRNELADTTTLYFWHTIKERLSEEGILITNVSLGGKSEEPYDDNADDYFYTASISLSMMTDWEMYEARPLFIRRITPYTYDQDAMRANEPNGILMEDPKGFTMMADIPYVYMVPAFERVR